MSSHSISASVIYKNERRRKTGHGRMFKSNLLNLVENKLDSKRIVTKGESSSRYADSKQARKWKNEEIASTSS